MVGYRPLWLMILSKTFVPNFGSPSPVIGFFLIISTLDLIASMNVALSITSILSEPLTTMAFRFLLPITAPTPVLPAALALSLIIAANLTSFSPAGPMQATLALLSPNSSNNMSVVSCVSLPHRCVASFIWTSLSLIEMYTGLSAFPSIINRLHPAFLNSAPKNPPELLDAIVPVSGPFVTTMYLPAVGTAVPVNRPFAKINLFSSLSGSIVGSISSNSILLANPLPPKYFLTSSPSIVSSLICPVERLILKAFTDRMSLLIHTSLF